MADNKENSRADDLFEILNELNSDESDSADNGSADNGKSIDELLGILNNKPEEAESEAEAEEVNEIPASIFGHLSDEGEQNAAQEAEINPHFSDHFVSVENEGDIPEDTDGEEDNGEGEEEDSKVKKVGRFFRGMSFIPKAVIYIVLMLIASAYLSYYIITIGNDVFALVSDDREITITLEEGATHETVAQLLEDNGIIEYGWVYELYMKYRSDGDSSNEYIAGEHTLNLNDNYSNIIYTLTTVYVERQEVRVTIPEGYTVEQIITLLVDSGVGQREDYIEAVNEYPYKWDFVRQLEELGYSEDRIYRLEGYLYPDTYDFYTDQDEVYVINEMLNAFYDRFWKDFTETDENGESYQTKILEEYGMTFDDIIVLASMVQSEGGTAEDFYFVSYVFHNRIENADSFPKLESDATIQYVLPERIQDSSLINKSFESPYNTYLYDGLPPGAISNPGLDALSATLFPDAPVTDSGKTIDAYFFVSNNAGKTYYSSTKSGHDKNVAQVKLDNEAIKAGTYEG